MARFLSGIFRVIRTNRFLPDQLISTRLIGRDQRLITIFDAIGEGQKDSRCQRDLAMGFRNRIIQGLAACEGSSTTQLFRVGRIRCTFR